MSTFNTAYTATATNGAATITLAAIPGKSNTVSGVAWSYSATPTASNPTLTITDNGSTVFVIYITSGGPGFIPFGAFIGNAAVNTALVATLAAGGTGIIGSINWTGVSTGYPAP